MIFDNPFFTEMLLPFLLVFVVVFAILQKSKILGEGKAQVDAMVALVVGLILIGVPGPRDILVGIMPWMAVGVAVILVFLILYGFVAGDLSGAGTPAWLKNVFMGLATLFTLGVVLFVSGLGSKLWDSFGGSSDVWMNVIMIVLVLGAMAVAIFGAKKKKD
ncbi:hypothetical protein KAT36_00805 [Candidatus Pacearchaeota archaeon]|nr:hypothetical protein [Candidatus Pacearchaeota archaeon]